MSIASEITRINNNISSAYTACNNKGATMPVTQDSANLANTISSIPAGGGGAVEEKDVNFYDYDGTLLYSYTKTEFLALTELPANPTHTGLTAQGWNWSLSDAKDYVTDYGMLDIGQMYVTSDGKTKFYITLDKEILKPYIEFAVNGSVIVDWGDGTTETVTGTSESNIIYTQHIYSNAGDYIISLQSSSKIFIIGNSSYGGIITKYGSGQENRVYNNSLKKIELGSNINLGTNAFIHCNSLQSITMTNEAFSTSTNTFFSNNYNLKYITIPDGQIPFPSLAGTNIQIIAIPKSITSAGQYCFNECRVLKRISLPNGLTTLSNYLFKACRTLEKISISKNATSLGSSIFSGCYLLQDIVIPNETTTIKSLSFEDCYTLKNMVLPNKIQTIEAQAFKNCYGMKYYDFTKHTSIPTLANTNAFTSIPSDCKIVVPDSLYSTWIAESNWTSYANYIIKESDYNAS